MKTSKILLSIILITVLCSYSFGQSAVQGEYKATIDGWLVDLNEAQILSLKTGKPILANFTGSDWCGWCIRLKRDVFKTDKFKAWAKENVILLELDYPRKTQLPAKIKDQNAKLQKAFNVRAFPTIWVFKLAYDPATNQNVISALANAGYMASADAWLNDMNIKLKKK